MTTNTYEVIAPGMVKVCAWCFPGNSITAKFPELVGMSISHGVCPTHKTQFLASIRNIRPTVVQGGAQ